MLGLSLRPNWSLQSFPPHTIAGPSQACAQSPGRERAADGRHLVTTCAHSHRPPVPHPSTLFTHWPMQVHGADASCRAPGFRLQVVADFDPL